jgi:hypothetical protein
MITPEKIARAIKYTAFAKKNPADVADVNFYLARDEAITQEQLDAHHAAAGAPVAEPEPWLVELPAVEEVPVAHVEEVEPALTVAQAQRAVTMAQLRLRAAVDKQRQARGRVSAALQKWTAAIGVSLTPEQNAREYIASSIQQRADRAAGHGSARRGRVMRSVVDATANAFNSGNGRNGGGNAFRRVVKLPDGSWTRPMSGHDRGRM